VKVQPYEAGTYMADGHRRLVVKLELGPHRWARCTNNSTAGYVAAASAEDAPRSIGGTCSGAMASSCSPESRSAARLATNTDTPGQAVRMLDKIGPASRTCSNPSTTSSSSRALR